MLFILRFSLVHIVNFIITAIGFGHKISKYILTISVQFINNIVEGRSFFSCFTRCLFTKMVLCVIYCRTNVPFYMVKTILSIYNYYCSCN